MPALCMGESDISSIDHLVTRKFVSGLPGYHLGIDGVREQLVIWRAARAHSVTFAPIRNFYLTEFLPHAHTEYMCIYIYVKRLGFALA